MNIEKTPNGVTVSTIWGSVPLRKIDCFLLPKSKIDITCNLEIVSIKGERNEEKIDYYFINNHKYLSRSI